MFIYINTHYIPCMAADRYHSFAFIELMKSTFVDVSTEGIH